MSDSTKVVNYTEEMIEKIKAAAPLNMEKAKAVGLEIDRSYRSVVAKAKSLGIAYESKPAPAKKPKARTKVETVALIAGQTGLDLEGLEKAPVSVLNALLDYTTPETTED